MTRSSAPRSLLTEPLLERRPPTPSAATVSLELSTTKASVACVCTSAAAGGATRIAEHITGLGSIAACTCDTEAFLDMKNEMIEEKGRVGFVRCARGGDVGLPHEREHERRRKGEMSRARCVRNISKISHLYIPKKADTGEFGLGFPLSPKFYTNSVGTNG